MSADEYVPMATSEADARECFIIGMIRDGEEGDWDEYREEAGPAFDRFLARVRRDAAREALDGLANESVGAHNAPPYLTPQIPRSFVEFASLVTWYRDTHYPEETP